MKTSELYDKVTTTIIELLEQVDVKDFQNHWNKIVYSQPKNVFKNTLYTGINTLYLSAIAFKRNYKTNNWLTFHEVQQLNAKIRKGSKSAEVIFFKMLYFDKNNQAIDYEQAKLMKDITKKRYLKYYHVFNVDDVEGLPEQWYNSPFKTHTDLTAWEQNNQAEELIFNTGAEIEYKAQNSAYYSITNDKIILPIKEQFKGDTPFYNTCFHELIHWTGHADRLNRELDKNDNQIHYAFEELTAEIGASFLCAHFGFENHLVNSAQYVKSWLTALKNDTSMIFKASAKAQHAVNYILEFTKVKEELY